MKLPRDLSGTDLIQILCRRYGYRQVHQEGSHTIEKGLGLYPNPMRWPWRNASSV